MSKVKAVESATTPKPTTSAAVLKTNPKVPCKVSIPKVDLSKLHMVPVPRDGQWCCKWVNEIPVGIASYLKGPKQPTVIVEDWRLPAGWIKHLRPRPYVGEWDVVLVSNIYFRVSRQFQSQMIKLLFHR